MSTSGAQSFDHYMQLMRSGVPPMDAFRQAFPQGIQSDEERARQEQKEKSKGSMAQLGGYAGGALVVKAGSDLIKGQPVLGELREGISKAGERLSNALSPSDAAAQTGAAANQAGAAAAGGAANYGQIGTATDGSAIMGPMEVTETLPAGSTTTSSGGVLQPDGTITDATGTIDYGRWAQGIGGGIQIYQGYQQWQDGDKIGGGLGMAAGAANVGGSLGSTTMGQAAGPIGAAYGAYSLGKMAYDSGDYTTADTGNLAMQGAVAGASVGSYFGPWGTAIGAALGGIYGAGMGLTASGKNKYQLIRDKWRENIIEGGSGLFDANYQGTLADGSSFDFGADGSKLKMDRSAWGTEAGSKAAAYGNLFAALQGATSTKPQEAIATQLMAASTSNAGGNTNVVRDNYRHWLGKMGVNYEDAVTQLDALRAGDKIDQHEYEVYKNDLGELVGPNAQSAQPQQNRNVSFRNLPSTGQTRVRR